MNFGKLPPWSTLIVAALFSAGLVFFAYNFAPFEFNAKQKQIESLEEQLEKKRAEIRKGELAVMKMEELKRDIASLERKLADLKQILPTAPEMGDLLRWIKSVADQTNLELQVFTPGAQTDREFLREQPVTMDVIGDYHQLGMFFDRISKYARIINVENVRINPNNDRSFRATIRAGFVAKTYIYKDEPKPAEEAP